MIKSSFKKVLVIFIAALLALTFSVSAFAEVPYESYTYWSDVGDENKAVYNRPMYSAEYNIDAVSLGIEPFTKIKDITFDSEGNLFVLDSASRIVVLDQNYTLVREIGLIGGTETYVEASGLYIAKDNTIYICDTEGHRILHITADGNLINTITLPESNLIPEDFDFRPTNMAIDEYGYTYILSDGSYYGALLYDADMEFLGFYGANTVTASVSSVFSNIKNRIFPNNAIVGGSGPIATGVALYKKCNKKPGIVVANAGDGAAARGPVYEAMNFAAMDQYNELWEDGYKGGLPIIFNFNNNHYGMGGQTKGETMAYGDLARLGCIAQNQMNAERINGWNPLAVIDAYKRKRKLLEEGKGPVLLDVVTYRLSGHSTSDAMSYRTKEEVEEYRKIVEGATNLATYDRSIMLMIEEEAEPFFENKKSAEKVAEIIQSRVEIYVNERK